MSIDIKKVIRDSLEKPLQESEQVEHQSTIQDSKISNESPFNIAVATSISAGLGALSLRNKIRRVSAVNEMDVNDVIEKVGEKAGSLGRAAMKIGKKVVGNITDKASDLSGQVMDKAGDVGSAASKMANKFAKSPAGLMTKYVSAPAATGAVAGVGIAKGIGAIAEKLRRRKEENM